MNKKQPASRFSRPKSTGGVGHWHNGADAEIHLYAGSLQRAAKILVGHLNSERNPQTARDVCPIILLFGECVELHLKALVGEGRNFLESKTDPISLYKTHSLRWLAQIVCQIIRAVGWESEFKCEGVSNLADFSSVVAELEALDPVTGAVQVAGAGGGGSVAETFQKIDCPQFVFRMDSLIHLLNSTTDALATTWDMRDEAGRIEALWTRGGGPIVQ